MTRSCAICDNPRRADIDNVILVSTAAVVQAWLAAHNMTVIHRNTISRHKRLHMPEVALAKHREATKMVKMLAKDARRPNPTQRDFAVLVRDSAVIQLESGNMVPTVLEGLKAQELLDRRETKHNDRDAVLVLVQAIAGAIGGPIEGQYRELGDGE